MKNCQRITLAPDIPVANANIYYQYPVQRASWILHPEHDPNDGPFWMYEFTLSFEMPSAGSITLHVSADQRFELLCDGQYVGMGPDRSDIRHWSFHSYTLDLEAGNHTLSAQVHFMTDEFIPNAQISRHPGFILASEDSPVPLNTGDAPWTVRRLNGYSVSGNTIPNYHVVGPNYTIDGRVLFADTQEAKEPTAQQALAPGLVESRTGCICPGWRLQPSRLPEQTRRAVGGGRIRMVADLAQDECLKETPATENAVWQALIDGSAPVTIPANTRQTVLWDLDEYHSAYPEVVLSGGKDASLEMLWAEACFVPPADGSYNFGNNKGNRNEFDGKRFLGYGDTFINDGQANRLYQVPWWRAGRYVLICVQTADEALTVERIGLQESRLPLEHEGAFSSNDEELNTVIPIAVRGIQMCSHETYMDCPYYEQMMYVGDTRLQVLTSFVISREDRLNQRALELFDWSRQEAGYVLERYPSTPLQLSPTFSMIWVLMLRDYAWWRRDPAFVRNMIKGMRGLLEEFKAHQEDAPLLTNLPGWSFIDWVPSWFCGYAPDGEKGCSAINNLLFLNSLVSAADLEEAYGEAYMAEAYRAWAKRLAASIKETFWDETRGLFADNTDHTLWSEHAQCLALLSGQYDAPLADRCFAGLIEAEDLARTTVYFSYYLLETLYRFGRGDLIYKKLDFWKGLVSQGFKTPVEAPEPSRSDCHAWGSHPLFHMHASLAGIRPVNAGFDRVRIAPDPGELDRLCGKLPHPNGMIEYTMEKQEDVWTFDIRLPEGLGGELVWQGKTHSLQAGEHKSLKA